MTTNTSLPSILTANTYFWTPCSNAAGRRRNEERHAEAVRDFFLSQGFTEASTGEYRKDGCVVEFSYSESCKNVYKHFSTTINGKRSNVRGLAKFLS